MSEWIEWNGGERPISGKTLVDVRFGDGRTCVDRPAELWNWKHIGSQSSDIIAYRLLSPQEPVKESPEQSVEALERFAEVALEAVMREYPKQFDFRQKSVQEDIADVAWAMAKTMLERKPK